MWPLRLFSVISNVIWVAHRLRNLSVLPVTNHFDDRMFTVFTDDGIHSLDARTSQRDVVTFILQLGFKYME